MEEPRFERLSYSLDNFATAVDVSKEKVRQHIDRGLLRPAYVDSKPVITVKEGLRWLESLPAERPERKS